MSMNNDDQLEKQFGDLIVWLEASRPANPPVPADFRSNVQNRILNYRTAQQRRLVPVSIALAVTLLVVGVFLWAVSPRPVSAAEIISRASQVATSGSAALQSYTGIEVLWMRSAFNADGSAVNTLPLEPNTETYLWVKFPNLFRTEWHSFNYVPAPSQPSTSTPDAAIDLSKVPPVGPQNALVVNDGSTVWWQDVYAETVTLRSAATQMQPIPSDYKSLLSQLNAQNDNVKLIGTVTIAGREAYMLNFTPKPDQLVWAGTTQITIWIDTQTYFQLGQKSFDKNGLVIYGWLYTEFQPNVDIPADRFTFTPDPTYRIVDLRTPKNAADLDLAWRTAASKAAFKVFRPVNVPTSLMMERPYFSFLPDAPTGVQQNFYSPDNGHPVLLIMEEPGTSINPLNGTAIKVGQYDGDYYEVGVRRLVRFVRDGTLITLQSSQQVMSKDDLIQLARTMQPVPKA